ncbi:MAG: selenocysteine-specific elongation factor [Halioglobus sp.]
MSGAASATSVHRAAANPQTVIIATAGHVDHGKTSLIKQLTGVETDRLEEEKRRGLSINLGYAYLPCEGETPIGFIDVPGHSRFINTMISGISGIDMGMLVVAADDGPMPQTLEHLDVLQVLGVETLVLVLSKIDRVDSARLDVVEQEARALLKGRNWNDIIVHRISNETAEGIDDLKAELLNRGNTHTAEAANGSFRLSIDRAFNLKGTGLVVTGTASTGEIKVGETLKLLPAGTEVRVRSLRVHDQDAERATAGQRCAINLAGSIEKSDIERGDWLLQADAGDASANIDVDFTLLPGAPFSLKHLSPIKLHIGAKRIAGRLALLKKPSDENRLQPGEQCIAQLVLESPVAAFHGQRFLLRDHAENVVLGGGTVLDPFGERNSRSRTARLEYLQAMQEDSPLAALNNLLSQGQLVNLNRYRLIWNLRETDTGMLVPDEAHTFEVDKGQWVVNTARWQQAQAAVVAAVRAWHDAEPKAAGIKANALKSSLASVYESPLFVAALTKQLRVGVLVLSEGLIRQKQFKPAVSEEFAADWQKFEQFLTGRGNQIPLLSEVSEAMRQKIPALERIAACAARDGRTFKLTNRRYALPAQLLNLSKAVVDVANEGEAITVVTLKKRWDTGRNLTVEILEYFDEIRFTQRKGNERIVLDAELPARKFGR